MANNDTIIDIAKRLCILKNEGELIIKPFHSAHEINAVECGKVVSRSNKPLFDYQIGDKTNRFMISSIFNRKILLLNPETKEIVLELYHNRLPFLFKGNSKQAGRCLPTLSNETQSIGSIHRRFGFTKIWYDVYNNKREHVASLILRKSYLRSKIQHRVPEFEILDHDKTTNIGRIYSYSTDLERTGYGHAIAIKIPQNMKVEIKATLLIAALILKSRLN